MVVLGASPLKICSFFYSEKFREFFGQGAESGGAIAREWSCRLRVKWNSLFLGKPGQRIISESAEGQWKHWIGSFESFFFMVLSVLGASFAP